MSKSDPRPAVKDIVDCLRKVFKKYTLGARKTAWNSITSKEAEREIQGLIRSPSKPVIGIPRLVSFKEWLETVSNEDGDSAVS